MTWSRLSFSVPRSPRLWALGALSVILAGRFGTVTASARRYGETPRCEHDARDQALLRFIRVSSTDAIISSDLAGRITTWNPAAEQLFGFSAAEALDHPLDQTLPSAYEAEWTGFLARVRAASPPQTLHTKRRRKNGALADVEIVAATIRNPGGTITGYVSMVRDLSEQTRTAQAMGELVHQLQAAKSALTQLDATKTQIVTTISHEIRTPLTSIQGYSELIETEDLTDEEVRSFARAINQNAVRLDRLTSDVLNQHALDTGHRQISHGATLAEPTRRPRPRRRSSTVRWKPSPQLSGSLAAQQLR